jgi:hypothetical protein
LDKINETLNQWGSQWLNSTEKIIIIKSIMLAFPLYQLLDAGQIINKGYFWKRSMQEERERWKGKQHARMH